MPLLGNNDLMNSIRFLASKQQEVITKEWDNIAPMRDEQLATNNDASYLAVLEPWIINRLNGAETVIDIGCGTGRLTSEIQKAAFFVLGIDPSSKSIELARVHDKTSEYAIATAEEWVEGHPSSKFDVAVANMVLMDALDLDGICSAVAKLARGGRVLATITHPAFWPVYWGYASNDEFSYSKELIVEAPFKTSSYDFFLPATHVHRPLSRYLQAFHRAGMTIVSFEELRGTEAPNEFPFPRFLALEAAVADNC